MEEDVREKGYNMIQELCFVNAYWLRAIRLQRMV